jgi:hypothetical protein
MKTEALKKIIKEAVREAIQEELKEVLLEAVKAPKAIITQPTQPTQLTSTTQPALKNDDLPPGINSITPTSKPSLSEQRQKYMDVLGETGLNLKSGDAQTFNPKGNIDTTSPNGQLPGGEVGMDQIMGLMTNR